MNGWQVDVMWEADAAAAWERMNAPDPAEEELKDAARCMDEAVGALNYSLDYLSEAVAALHGYPMAYKVQSFIDGIENLITGLDSLKETYERGRRD